MVVDVNMCFVVKEIDMIDVNEMCVKDYYEDVCKCVELVLIL